MAPADLPAFDKLLAEARQCSSKGELSLQCQDGSARPGPDFFQRDARARRRTPSASSSPTSPSASAPRWRCAQAHDTLEQRVIERTAELQREREWLSVTLASIGDALIATDADGRITFLNPVAEALTGWRQEDALGQPVQEVFRTLHEGTRAPGEDIVRRVLCEGRIVKLANNTALVTRDGREVPVEDSAAPITLDGEGKVAGAVLVFRDVTEKRRVLKELRASDRSWSPSTKRWWVASCV